MRGWIWDTSEDSSVTPGAIRAQIAEWKQTNPADLDDLLYVACERSRLDIVKELVNVGASVNSCSRVRQDTPLHCVAAKLNVELVNYLIANGADTSATDKGGQLPLHVILQLAETDDDFEKALEILACLLVLDPSKIDAKDKWGQTPLHKAVRTQAVEIVDYLLAKDADCTLKDFHNFTPWETAVDHGEPSILGAVLSKEAQASPWLDVDRLVTRGIGIEFVKQLLEAGHPVIAVVRDLSAAPKLFDLISSKPESTCIVEQCDISTAESIDNFASKVLELAKGGLEIDAVVLNAGILNYPNRATELSFSSFAQHLHISTIGPTICAQKLLFFNPDKLVFISSDSGSAGRFNHFEDGFAAYSASKSALNQMLRHMAVELIRQEKDTKVLALHPGEVETDMANVELGWEVKGSIKAEESVKGMLDVIGEKGDVGQAGFWCWDGREYPW